MTAQLVELVGGPQCGASYDLEEYYSVIGYQFFVAAHDGTAIYAVNSPAKARFLGYAKPEPKEGK